MGNAALKSSLPSSVTKTRWVGSAFQHRMQLSVGLSIILAASAIPVGLNMAKANAGVITGTHSADHIQNSVRDAVSKRREALGRTTPTHVSDS